MIYLRPGLFAEGATDYDFFLELIDSLVVEIAAEVLGGGFEIARPVFNIDRAPDLPSDPESEMDPKRVLRAILASLGARPDRGIRKYYVELGREVRPAELRRLPAFRRFEADLRLAIASLAPPTPAAT